MGPGCDGGGGGSSDGEVATTRGELSSDASAGAGSEEDRLSALPDDMLVLILGRLGTCDAARTSVLSRRWRRVWALLPSLHFWYVRDLRQIGRALEAHQAALRSLIVFTQDAGLDSVAAWLPAAARALSGVLSFHNGRKRNAEEALQRGAIELPCLERATVVQLQLGFLGLAVPPAGVFSRLTALRLRSVRFHGPGSLGDAVSWPRCPCLQNLIVIDARGLDNFTIHSDSLRHLELTNLRGLQHLNIVAPALKELKVAYCFFYGTSQPVASITAPRLATLRWMDSYDPSSVHLDEMRHLQLLRPLFFTVYEDWDDNSTHNQSCLSLLQHFKVVESLILTLNYPSDIDDHDYVMEEMTMLPDITILRLDVFANRHAFGASAFHVLRICCSIKSLILSFFPPTDTEVEDTEVEACTQTTCPPGCICGEHQSWETEHLSLNRLKEVEVIGIRGSEHEVTFVKQLFNWAKSLEKMRVVFDKGCICGEHQSWETEHLSLNHLKEVEVAGIRGSEHEVTFVKQLLNWATSLEKIRVVFDMSITESVAKELSQVLRSFAKPGIRMETSDFMEDVMLKFFREKNRHLAEA